MPINSIDVLEQNAIVDVAGVIISTGELSSFQPKNGAPKDKRVIAIADESGSSVNLTLWGSCASDCSYI